MLNVILVLCITINTLVCLHNAKRGITLYLAFSLLLPNMKIGNLALTYEIAGFLPVAVAFLWSVRHFSGSFIHACLTAWVSLVLVSTLLAVNLQNADIYWIGIFGYIRFALILFMAIAVLDQDTLTRILFCAVLINLFVSAFQLAYPRNVQLFMDLYTRETGNNMKYFLHIGRLTRATGTFSSPVNLGGLSLIAFALFYGKLLLGERSRMTLMGLFASVATGIFSTTKTTVLGVPLIILLGLVFYLLMVPKRHLWKELGNLAFFLLVCLVATVLIFLTIGLAKGSGFSIDRVLSILQRPTAAFDTRLDKSKGLLSTTQQVIQDNLLVGIGKTFLHGEFIGDNSYLVILHDSGIIGMSIFVLLLGLVARAAVQRRDLPGVLLFAALLICALALASFTNLFGALIIVYILTAKSKEGLSHSVQAELDDPSVNWQPQTVAETGR